jgi:putative transcriptional regulator
LTKRNIFDELLEGVEAMKGQRGRKLTLRSYKIDVAPLPKVDSKLLRDTRKKLRCSRAVFARKLRINERTLEKWEQGRAKPNPQAAALVLLVRKYPDTLARLDTLVAR